MLSSISTGRPDNAGHRFELRRSDDELSFYFFMSNLYVKDHAKALDDSIGQSLLVIVKGFDRFQVLIFTYSVVHPVSRFVLEYSAQYVL